MLVHVCSRDASYVTVYVKTTRPWRDVGALVWHQDAGAGECVGIDSATNDVTRCSVRRPHRRASFVVALQPNITACSVYPLTSLSVVIARRRETSCPFTHARTHAYYPPAPHTDCLTTTRLRARYDGHSSGFTECTCRTGLLPPAPTRLGCFAAGRPTCTCCRRTLLVVVDSST